MVTTLQREPAESLGSFDVPANRLSEAFAWLKAPEIPVPLVIGVQSSIWFSQVGSFREKEESLSKEDYDNTLVDHRAALSKLISGGEDIVFLAKKCDISKLPSGITLEDIEATIESLQITFQSQYRAVKNGKLSELVKSLFNGHRPENR